MAHSRDLGTANSREFLRFQIRELPGFMHKWQGYKIYLQNFAVNSTCFFKTSKLPLQGAGKWIEIFKIPTIILLSFFPGPHCPCNCCKKKSSTIRWFFGEKKSMIIPWFSEKKIDDYSTILRRQHRIFIDSCSEMWQLIQLFHMFSTPQTIE